jgi:hypothetical protein
MKTKQYISAMLIALVFATASIQAQTARRPMTQEKEQRAKTTNTQVRKTSSQKARSTQPASKVQSQQAHQQKAKAPARKVNTQQARPNQAAAPARKVNTQQARPNQAAAPARKLSTPEQRPASMTIENQTRTGYRKSANNSFATPRYSAPKHTEKYHNMQYYGGHYYHYAYPITKVKFHYHHDTYLHHYNVLYYPSYTNIYWTRSMYRNYRTWYPEYHWNYNYGHSIQTISIFDAQYNMGEVAMVYGRVYATWYNKETDDYLLFFGGDYPYQQFTVVLPGYVARKFSWRPERYFLGEHVTTTGLITTFDGSPEIVVKNKRQIGIY